MLGMASACSFDGLNPAWHALDEVLTHRGRDFVPNILNPFPELGNPSWRLTVPCQKTLKMRPEVFDRIQIRRVRGLHENHVLVVLKEPACDLSRVLGVVILLKNHLLWMDAVVLLGQRDTLV